MGNRVFVEVKGHGIGGSKVKVCVGGRFFSESRGEFGWRKSCKFSFGIFVRKMLASKLSALSEGEHTFAVSCLGFNVELGLVPFLSNSIQNGIIFRASNLLGGYQSKS
jgi:hypothetical protein